jgi:uncharacterized membrane protein YdjX (TVP38/TMEM64 family)
MSGRSGTPGVYRRRRLAAGAALTAVVLAATLASPADALASLAWLAADPVRYGLALCCLAAVRPLFVWPTTLLAVAAGFGYGPAAAPLGLALVTLSAVPTYLVARRIGGEGRVGDAAARVRATTGGLRGTVATRLLPIPSDAVSAGAGVAGVPLPAFVVGTAVGEAPWALAGALAGSTIESLTTGSLAAAADWRLVAAAGAVGVGLLVGPAYRTAAGDGASADAGTRPGP